MVEPTRMDRSGAPVPPPSADRVEAAAVGNVSVGLPPSGGGYDHLIQIDVLSPESPRQSPLRPIARAYPARSPRFDGLRRFHDDSLRFLGSSLITTHDEDRLVVAQVVVDLLTRYPDLIHDVIPPLLHNRSPVIVEGALVVLGLLGPLAEPYRPSLIRLLDHPEKEIVIRAMGALVLISPEDQRQEVIEILKAGLRGDPDPTVGLLFRMTLWQLGDRSDIRERLDYYVKYLTWNPVGDFNLHAVHALMAMGDEAKGVAGEIAEVLEKFRRRHVVDTDDLTAVVESAEAVSQGLAQAYRLEDGRVILIRSEDEVHLYKHLVELDQFCRKGKSDSDPPSHSIQSSNGTAASIEADLLSTWTFRRKRGLRRLYTSCGGEGQAVGERWIPYLRTMLFPRSRVSFSGADDFIHAVTLLLLARAGKPGLAALGQVLPLFMSRRNRLSEAAVEAAHKMVPYMDDEAFKFVCDSLHSANVDLKIGALIFLGMQSQYASRAVPYILEALEDPDLADGVPAILLGLYGNHAPLDEDVPYLSQDVLPELFKIVVGAPFQSIPSLAGAVRVLVRNGRGQALAGLAENSLYHDIWNGASYDLSRMMWGLELAPLLGRDGLPLIKPLKKIRDGERQVPLPWGDRKAYEETGRQNLLARTRAAAAIVQLTHEEMIGPEEVAAATTRRVKPVWRPLVDPAVIQALSSGDAVRGDSNRSGPEPQKPKIKISFPHGPPAVPVTKRGGLSSSQRIALLHRMGLLKEKQAAATSSLRVPVVAPVVVRGGGPSIFLRR